jgi:uncharacterized membrane protein
MDYILYFFIFSFFGWILETVYASFLQGRFVSKQTLLKSPLCPVYGIGAVAFILTLRPVSASWILVFCGGFFVASSVEYLIALYYEHFFGVMWWDYRYNKGNLNGKVCAGLSLIWGFIAIAFFKFIFPAAQIGVAALSPYSKILVSICLTAFFIKDYSDTLKEIKKYSKDEPSLADGKFAALKKINY